MKRKSLLIFAVIVAVVLLLWWLFASTLVSEDEGFASPQMYDLVE